MSVDKNMAILVVDDNATMIKIIKNLLTQLGFTNIEQATDGQAALRKLEEHGQIKLIVSDWNMSPMTGLDFLKSVRSNPKMKDIPFVMVTAESKVENIVVAKEAGVSNYIVKPFNLVTLQQKLSAVLGPI